MRLFLGHGNWPYSTSPRRASSVVSPRGESGQALDRATDGCPCRSPSGMLRTPGHRVVLVRSRPSLSSELPVPCAYGVISRAMRAPVHGLTECGIGIVAPPRTIHVSKTGAVCSSGYRCNHLCSGLNIRLLLYGARVRPLYGWRTGSPPVMRFRNRTTTDLALTL
jgi:hypothetical protein